MAPSDAAMDQASTPRAPTDRRGDDRPTTGAREVDADCGGERCFERRPLLRPSSVRSPGPPARPSRSAEPPPDRPRSSPRDRPPAPRRRPRPRRRSRAATARAGARSGERSGSAQEDRAGREHPGEVVDEGVDPFGVARPGRGDRRDAGGNREGQEEDGEGPGRDRVEARADDDRRRGRGSSREKPPHPAQKLPAIRMRSGFSLAWYISREACSASTPATW